MIAKISSSNNLYGALSYNQNKVEDKHAQVIFSNKMIEPKDGNFDISTCLLSFENYLLANKRTEKPVIHLSINPDPKDKLSDEQLSEIAQTYMQKMGYSAQPFIVYKHEDIERKHIHIVSVRVDENGRKIDGNFERRRSMDVCRDLEQKYGLIPADQKQKSQSSLLSLKPVNHKNGDIKHQIANVIRPIAKDYHFQSLKEYRALLTLYNIGVEEVKGEIGGKEYKGLIYSALNKKGEKTGNPFKSSLFGKSVGIEALEKRMEQSAETIKNKRLKERSKKVISAVMLTSKRRADFEGALAKQGISVIFRENEQGRIYGATFIDHEQKCVFNGSRLGKEFSANVFNDLFNAQKQDFNDTDKKSSESFNHENQGSGIGGLFDLLPTEAQGDNFEEEAFIRRLKKKKRKQRRL
ncbi:mobilization protein [Bacteroidia bacterium]|nr:mobilization protein [Bacteroidia bacterium]